MGLTAEVIPLSPAEYLAWEVSQPEKHEYYAREVFAMGRASRNHVAVSLNVATILGDRLEDSPCRGYMADMRLEVSAANGYFRPDAIVTCDPADRRVEYVLGNPDERRIELYRRDGENRWLLVDIEPDAPLPLGSLDVEILWWRVFRNVDSHEALRVGSQGLSRKVLP